MPPDTDPRILRVKLNGTPTEVVRVADYADIKKEMEDVIRELKKTILEVSYRATAAEAAAREARDEVLRIVGVVGGIQASTELACEEIIGPYRKKQEPTPEKQEHTWETAGREDGL